MEQNAVDATASGAAAVADLSLLGLFWQADWVVKAVIIGLILASVWCWTIIFSKLTQLAQARRRADRFEDTFRAGGSTEDLYIRLRDHAADPMSLMFIGAMEEWRRIRQASKRGLSHDTITSSCQRIERAMQVVLARELNRLERGLTFLASIASTAPFVGLFGTVWGIMNSFASIASSKQTSLAVVAPGIAEALLATALGLVAAIPAAFAYNRIAGELSRYAHRLELFIAEFEAMVAVQLQERL